MKKKRNIKKRFVCKTCGHLFLDKRTLTAHRCVKPDSLTLVYPGRKNEMAGVLRFRSFEERMFSKRRAKKRVWEKKKPDSYYLRKFRHDCDNKEKSGMSSNMTFPQDFGGSRFRNGGYSNSGMLKNFPRHRKRAIGNKRRRKQRMFPDVRTKSSPFNSRKKKSNLIQFPKKKKRVINRSNHSSSNLLLSKWKKSGKTGRKIHRRVEEEEEEYNDYGETEFKPLDFHLREQKLEELREQRYLRMQQPAEQLGEGEVVYYEDQQYLQQGTEHHGEGEVVYYEDREQVPYNEMERHHQHMSQPQQQYQQHQSMQHQEIPSQQHQQHHGGQHIQHQQHQQHQQHIPHHQHHQMYENQNQNYQDGDINSYSQNLPQGSYYQQPSQQNQYVENEAHPHASKVPSFVPPLPLGDNYQERY